MKRSIAMMGALLLSAAISVPAAGASIEECQSLLRNIQRSKTRAQEGSYAPSETLQAARAVEERARNDMVSAGCNKKANAGSEQCVGLIAAVNTAKAESRRTQSDWNRKVSEGARVDEVEQNARYDAECRQVMNTARQSEQAKRQAKQQSADDAALIGSTVLSIGLGFGGAMSSPGGGIGGGRGGGGGRTSAPSGMNHR